MHSTSSVAPRLEIRNNVLYQYKALDEINIKADLQSLTTSRPLFIPFTDLWFRYRTA